jgi:hypothetical protein
MGAVARQGETRARATSVLYRLWVGAPRRESWTEEGGAESVSANFCQPGCNCRRHRVKSLEERMKHRFGKHPCPQGCICGKHKGGFSGFSHSETSRQAISSGVTESKPWGRRDNLALAQAVKDSWARLTPEEYAARCLAISEGDPWSPSSGHGFRGGPFAGVIAEILCPIGYIREHHVRWGPHQPTDHHILDFAHPEAKVNIELDGPHHDGSKDAVRDARLRALGWRIIRIRHE